MRLIDQETVASHRRIALTVACILLSGCFMTSRMWQEDHYLEHIYGAGMAMINDHKVVVLDGRKQQYLIDHSEDWDNILGQSEGALSITNMNAYRCGNRVEFSFTYTDKATGQKRQMAGVATVAEPDFVKFDRKKPKAKWNVKVIEVDSITKKGAKILATPLTVAADATGVLVGTPIIVVTFPIWTRFLILGW